MPTNIRDLAEYCATMFGSTLFMGGILLEYILDLCGRFAPATPQVLAI
jgi:hypothetical protein